MPRRPRTVNFHNFYAATADYTVVRFESTAPKEIFVIMQRCWCGSPSRIGCGIWSRGSWHNRSIGLWAYADVTGKTNRTQILTIELLPFQRNYFSGVPSNQSGIGRKTSPPTADSRRFSTKMFVYLGVWLRHFFLVEPSNIRTVFLFLCFRACNKSAIGYTFIVFNTYFYVVGLYIYLLYYNRILESNKFGINILL